MISKFLVSRDDNIYQAFPDVALTLSGSRLVCVFAECTHHGDRSYTRIMYTTSTDRGRSWAPKQPLSEPLRGDPNENPWWNCPRISTLDDGRLVAVCDRNTGRDSAARKTENLLWFSSDEGDTWDGPHATPVQGIVPDQLVELRRAPHAGRWVLSAHRVVESEGGKLWQEQCWTSDDRGRTWTGPHTIAAVEGLKLCEGSVVELPDGELACFLRENSGQGYDAYKCLSTDGGHTWSAPVRFPLPACHRPVAGMLRSGKVLITHRYMQGGKGWVGYWTQNTFAGLTDIESCLAPDRNSAHTRILPLDFDRSPHSDTGYTGWVQFDDGEIYVVNYILDDAPKGQIRGYSLKESDFLFGTA